MHFEYLNRLPWLLPLAIGTATGIFWWLNFRGRAGLRNAYAREEHMTRTSSRLSLMAPGELFKLFGYNLVAALIALSLCWPSAKHSIDSPGVGDLRVVGAFDVSGSMRADPYRAVIPTRTGAPAVGEHGTCLQMALLIHLNQVVKAAGRNQFSMLTYNTEAEEKVPFCEDSAAVEWLLRTRQLVAVGQAPGNGSDYNAGLAGAAQKIINEYDTTKRHFVVLYSDGGWKGDATARQAAIDKLKALKVKLIVVGLGSRKPVTVPIYLGERVIDLAPYGKQPKLTAQIDEPALLDLVKAYGPDATYIPMTPDSVSQINRDWWRSQFAQKQPDEAPEPLFEYFLIPAVALWALLLIRSTRGGNRSYREVHSILSR